VKAHHHLVKHSDARIEQPFLGPPLLSSEVFPHPLLAPEPGNQFSRLFRGTVVDQRIRGLHPVRFVVVADLVAFGNQQHVGVLNVDGHLIEDAGDDL
jgi:hypothetical protein